MSQGTSTIEPSRRHPGRRPIGRAVRIGLFVSMPLAFVVILTAQYTGLFDDVDLIRASEPYQLPGLAIGVLVLGLAVTLSHIRGAR